MHFNHFYSYLYWLAYRRDQMIALHISPIMFSKVFQWFCRINNSFDLYLLTCNNWFQYKSDSWTHLSMYFKIKNSGFLCYVKVLFSPIWVGTLHINKRHTHLTTVWSHLNCFLPISFSVSLVRAQVTNMKSHSAQSLSNGTNSAPSSEPGIGISSLVGCTYSIALVYNKLKPSYEGVERSSNWFV